VFPSRRGKSRCQWENILGVLRLHGAALDRAHRVRWAPEIGVDGLLARALAEAGLR
jgi:hypothetical protein